ncbi:MAG: CvpA family protein [Planctomycetota bacterium]|nr:MAG: CvpA family protein [Planctomycetota bacterium]
MLVAVILGLVFVTVFASLMTQGLWSNTIHLVNVITAALIATNYFEPVADFLDRQEPSWTYAWDFIALWILFGFMMIVLRMLTDFASRFKVRFFMPVEKAGGIIMALWVSWIVVCFTTMTLHTAPLARNFLRGGFQRDPEATMLFGLQPDRVWLGWVNRESRGTLSRFRGINEFDDRGEFILRYGNRRGEFEGQMTFTKSAGQ